MKEVQEAKTKTQRVKRKARAARRVARQRLAACKSRAKDGEQQKCAADAAVGMEGRMKVEARLRQLEGRGAVASSGNGGVKSGKTAHQKYTKDAGAASSTTGYSEAADAVMSSKKRSRDEGGDEEELAIAAKKAKKAAKKKRKLEEAGLAAAAADAGAEKSAKKAKKVVETSKPSIGKSASQFFFKRSFDDQ